MMKSLIMLAAVIAVASALPRLQFGRLIGGPYYEGENMTITCEDQPSSVGDLNSFSLYRIKGQEREPGTLIYKHYGVIGDTNPRERWSPQIDTRRYSVDQKTISRNGAKFRIIIRSLDCNDGGQYRCLSQGSTPSSASTPQNLTISTAPKNLRFAQYTNCRYEYSDRPEDNIDCGRSNCQAMARYGEVPSYTCSVSVPPDNYRQYSITWYKRIPNFEDESLIRTVTPSTINTRPNYGECESMQISSTILYAIQANDHNLVIECRLTGPRGQTSQFGDNSVMNASVTVCVTGLPMPTLRPQECTDRSFGLDCAQTCNCRDAAEACNKHTGACSSGCAAGFIGEECKSACSNGHYGMDCSESCDTCAGHSAGGQICNYVTGRCNVGCMPGYMGSLCNLVCDSGRYGLKCSKICNEKCISDENGLSPCHHVTGICIYGCQGEYTASVDSICALAQESVIAENHTAFDGGKIAGIIISCVLGLALIVALFFIYKQRMQITKATKTKTSQRCTQAFQQTYQNVVHTIDTNEAKERTASPADIVIEYKTEGDLYDVIPEITFANINRLSSKDVNGVDKYLH